MNHEEAWIERERLQKILYASLNAHAAEKVLSLFVDRYCDTLSALGFVNCISLIRVDIWNGKDVFTGKPLQQSNISISTQEIIKLATLLRSVEFGQEVAAVLEPLGRKFDLEKLSIFCESSRRTRVAACLINEQFSGQKKRFFQAIVYLNSSVLSKR